MRSASALSDFLKVSDDRADKQRCNPSQSSAGVTNSRHCITVQLTGKLLSLLMLLHAGF